jgi:hypothetical protein
MEWAWMNSLESVVWCASVAQIFCAEILPAIGKIQAGGAVTLRQIVAELNEQGIETPCGGQWSAVQVQRVMSVKPKAPMNPADTAAALAAVGV